MIYALYQCIFYDSMRPLMFSTNLKTILRKIKKDLKNGDIKADENIFELIEKISSDQSYAYQLHGFLALNNFLENAFVSYYKNGEDLEGYF